MKEPIRVLLVEDSPSQLTLLRAYIEATPDLVVVGTATNGNEAVQSTIRLRPNVVAMDIHLPVFDGYEATRQIMQQRPTPIVLFSSSAGNAEQRAIAALAAGALAFVRKPAGPRDPSSAADRDQFLRALRLMAGVKVVTRHPPRTTPVRARREPGAHYELLAIASSTGGPAALQTVLTDLGAGVATPIVIAQHVASGFARAMAGWLASVVPQPVHVIESETTLQAGHIYLPIDDCHLLITGRGSAGVAPMNEADRYCPSADRLFASVAQHYGAAAVGLIMTGMGEDGAQGLAALAAAGGATFGQDEASCVVYGMPKAAKALGAVRHELPLERLGLAIAALIGPAH